MKQRLLILGLMTMGLFSLTGCGTVQPWERGTLSDYTMRPDRDPLTDSMREHVYFTRESAAGGRGVGGGGCGCN
ncbi:MAG: DUF4266 domain-containing protein [bacterium]